MAGAAQQGLAALATKQYAGRSPKPAAQEDAKPPKRKVKMPRARKK